MSPFSLTYSHEAYISMRELKLGEIISLDLGLQALARAPELRVDKPTKIPDGREARMRFIKGFNVIFYVDQAIRDITIISIERFKGG